MSASDRIWFRGIAVAAGVVLGMAVLVPTVQADESGFVSDDFSAGLIDGRWTTVGPEGSVVTTSGQGTADAYVTIDVPGGVDHNPWAKATAPRVVQTVADTDMSIEVRFDSIPSQATQMEGILFVQDDTTFARFDIHRTAAGLRAFASTTTSGTAKKHLDTALPELTDVTLRVSRTGDRWRYAWSGDGATWTTVGTFTQDIAVSTVGPFAGTAGGSSAPAFRAEVDYAFDSGAPIQPEDGPAPEPVPTDEPNSDPTLSPGPDPTEDPSPGPNPTEELTPNPEPPAPETSTEPDPVADPTGSPTPEPTTQAPEPETPGDHDAVADAPGGVDSDDFASGALDPQVWSIIDPVGDGSVSLSGAGTADARLTIAVPAGRDHNPWTSASAPRAVQSVDDTDLSVEVKFDSIPTQIDQMQGLLFLQDATTFTRFDIHRKADGLKLFASSTVAGKGRTRLSTTVSGLSSAVHLRVARVADTWSLQWSPNGDSWITGVTFTQALTLQSVGPFAGNYGGTSAKAYTAAVDYVFDPATPIDPEDGGVAPTPDPTPTPDPMPTPDPTTDPTPDPNPSSGPFVSDDFAAGQFDSDLWTVVDPIGGAGVDTVSAGSQDARLAIALPAGTSRDAWAANDSTRVLQPTDDADFEVEAKFDSIPTQRYQDQGLIVQATPSRWLRFGTYSDGSSLYAFAASTTGTTSTKTMSKRITATGPSVWIRLTRTGNAWTFRTSANGTSWTTIGTTSQVLDVSAVGPYAGTADPSPAWTALVDYVFDTAAPISPEDGNAPPDTTHPTITDVSTSPGSNAISVAWSTDEFATGVAEVALAGTDTWSWQAETTTAGVEHAVTVPGLLAETAYKVRVRATDLAGNTSMSSIHHAATTESNGPDIDVWYGDTQRFGRPALAQPWVNVLGNVTDGDGVQSLRYSLNGATSKALSIGPDLRRLQYQGDFNADIRYSDLAVGTNTVTITAMDGIGRVSQETVTVVRQDTAPPALPFITDWNAQAPLTDQATVVDGKWTVSDSGVRVAPDATGYDRVIAVGDRTWTDFEMTVPFTVHGIGPGAGSPLSNEPMVGIGMRWQGHQVVDGRQPAWGYKSIGAYAWYRWLSPPRVELAGNGTIVRDHKNAQLHIGQPYVFKARADTVGSTTTYSMKMFPAGSAEPAAWDVTYTGSGPESGSVVLLAHHVDVTFGTVSITPVP